MSAVGTITLVILVSQLLLWAARTPIHRLLKRLARGLGNTARLAGRWCAQHARDLRERNRDVLRHAAVVESSGKVVHEMNALEVDLARDVADYRSLQRELSDLLREMDEDYREAAVAPSEAPGWTDAVAAASNMPTMESRAAQRVLDELRRSAAAGEKRALSDFRQASARRHKILSKISPSMTKTASLLQSVGRTMERVAESTDKLGTHVDRFHDLQSAAKGTDGTLQRAAWHTFAISLIVFVVAVAGGAINFQLIALPMAELVPSTSRITGIPVSQVAALVIVLLEVTAGVFMMEMLGVTKLFPNLQTLRSSRRRLILVIAVGGLFVLATVEASLAVLREQIVETENALNLTLAGSEAVDSVATSNIPMIGQAVLGFILPWILAMAAIPLELLVMSGSAITVALIAIGLQLIGGVLRVLGHGLRHTFSGVRFLFDAYIAIPLLIERLVSRRKTASENDVENDLEPIADVSWKITDEFKARP
ncbi:MAG: hypothetical protein AAFN74_13650 [Myxococcota bacterium]